MQAHSAVPHAVRKISFVIPAHNEEPLIGLTVSSIRQAADAVGIPYEIIVVDDASTDGTGLAAEAAGAHVIRVSHKHIAATRNSGAAVATGDLLIFVDGDTQVGESPLRETISIIEGGAVGGGAAVDFDGEISWWARTLLAFFVWQNHFMGLAAGCYIFCTRKAFDAVGGFDQTFYAAEEWQMSRALHTLGRVQIGRAPVLTSGRKLRTHTTREILGVMVRAIASGGRVVRSRKHLDIWYGPRRHDTTSP